MELDRGNTEPCFASLQRIYTRVGEQRDPRQVPKCPSQASGDSSPSCGVGPELRFGNTRQPQCFTSWQTPLRLLPLTAEGLEAAGALFFFFPVLVSQTAVGESAGVHCEPQLKSLAPGSFPKARSLEIGPQSRGFRPRNCPVGCRAVQAVTELLRGGNGRVRNPTALRV